MAWRPSEWLIEGILDNTQNGKVTGWMKYAGMKEVVKYNLKGNFHRDIRGAKVRLRGDGESANVIEAEKYMEGFSLLQKGKVGDMTAGREPVDYVSYPYFEHYGVDNGRVVLELEPDQVELLTQPIPAMESDPLDRKQQAENMADYLSGMAEAIGIPNPDKPEPKKLTLLFTQLGISPTISQIENFDTENRDNAKLYRAAQH